MKRKIAFLCIIFFCVNTLLAQKDTTVIPYSLQYYIYQGLENNLDILIKKEEQNISENNATYGNAGGLPSLSLDGGAVGDHGNVYQKTQSNEKSSEINNMGQTLDAGLNLSWTIFEGFKINASHKRLKELRTLGELNTRLTVENVVANIAQVYYAIIREEIRMKNLASSLELSRERLQIIKQRYDLGDASLLEYQQANVDFNNDQTAVLKQQEAIFASQLRLNQLLALDTLSTPVIINHQEMDFLEIGTQAQLIGDMQLYNTTLLAAESDIFIKEQDYRIIESRLYPSLSLNSRFAYRSNWMNDPILKQQQNLDLNYGLHLSMNIFDGLKTKTARENAELSIKISELNKKSISQSLETQLLTLWMRYNNNKELLEMERSNLEVAQSLFQTSMNRYTLGELSGIELREAQNNLLIAEENLSIAEFETKLCEISLLLLSGKILETLL